MASDPATNNSTVSVKAELTDVQLQMLKDLAGRRGVSPNTVLQQAIETEKLLADNVHEADEVIIKRPNNTYAKVLFRRVF
jgi:hypothetical protein